MPAARTSGPTQGELLQMTVEITAAYVSNNAVPAAEVAALIAGIHRALREAPGRSTDLLIGGRAR